MYELVKSLVALRDRETAAMHLPWLRAISGQMDPVPSGRSLRSFRSGDIRRIS
jgi:hypothetical protein